MSTPNEIVGLLKSRGWKVATAESCTGGYLAATITSIPGASEVLTHGFVTYSAAAKEDLGVPLWVIQKYTVYSEEVAKRMAWSACDRSRADFGVGVTGVLGPGDDQGCPEGTVWVVMTDWAKHDVLKLTDVHQQGISRTERRNYIVSMTMQFMAKFLVDVIEARR